LYKFSECGGTWRTATCALGFGERMIPTAFEPSERLRPYVRSIVVMHTRDEATRPVLPAAGLMLGIRFAGSTALVSGDSSVKALASAGLAGMRTTLRRMRTSAGGGVVVAQFHELGAARFFDPSLHELFGSITPLSDIASRPLLAEIEERLAGAATHAARAGLVDEFLCRSFRERSDDALVREAARVIRRTHGVVRIGALARDLGISQDALEKRFRRVAGASPKQLASIARFRSVVAGFERGETLTALAHRAGYFDQSHLIREFRSFTGEAPEAFLSARLHC
jgi:AraC-like DNA-binding protein